MARQGRADGTIRKYQSAVLHFLTWLDGENPVTQRRGDIERYLDEWHAGSAPSSATQRVRISALQRFYDYLDSTDALVDSEGREVRNPVDRVERPRARRKANDWLSPEEDAAILEAPIDARERVVIALFRWTGMRVSEVCSLRWDDVDEDARVLRVRTSKTEAGVRSLVLLPELASELAAWQRQLERRGLYRSDGPVLATVNGTAMKPQFAWRLVKRVASRAGVRDRSASDATGYNLSAVTPHTFRRTLATDLLNRGVRLEVVSSVLGHSDTRVTAAHYAELQDATAQTEVLRAMAREAS